MNVTTIQIKGMLIAVLVIIITDILISATTKAGLDDTVITEKLPPTPAKGLSEPLKLYKITRREDICLENS